MLRGQAPLTKCKQKFERKYRVQDRASSKGCTIRQTPQKIIRPDGGHGKIIIHGGCCFSGEAGDQGNCNRTCPDRTESQKTSDHQWEAMSTVLKAYENSIGVGIADRPKDLGDLRGVSYITRYSIDLV